MGRMRRALTGAVLAAGLRLTGCTQGLDLADRQDDAVPAEEAGDADRVDGGAEDADGVDPGTGGIDDDDTAADEDPDENDR